MRRWVFAGLLLAACATVPTDMRVSLSPPNYYPSKDTSLGIGLLPVAAPPAGVTPRYRWTADRGSFRSWSETTHEIEEFGRESVNNGGKLYWRYDAADMQTFTPAIVTVITEDAKTGKELAVTVIRFEFDGELVRVAR